MDTSRMIPFNGVFYDSNGNKHDLPEMAGRGVVDIQKTDTTDNIDTYTMTYSDGSISKFQVINGITPHIGTNGNWFLGDVDTGIPTVHIGENGNLFLGETDLGIAVPV